MMAMIARINISIMLDIRVMLNIRALMDIRDTKLSLFGYLRRVGY